MTKRLASAAVGLAFVSLVCSASAGLAANSKNDVKNSDAAAAFQPKIIQVKDGVKFFQDGDSIAINEVRATSPEPKTGDKVIVTGSYVLSSRLEAKLSLFVTDATGSGKSNILPEQIFRISKGQGTFELSTTLEYEGYLHVTFYSVPDGKPFGGSYFGTAKQMEEIQLWDLKSWYTANLGTCGADQESKTLGKPE